MANELLAALDELKAQVAAITGVQRAQLGQPLTALPDATHDKAVACVYLMTSTPLNDAYSSTSETHRAEMRFYWLLTPSNVELVEQSAARMWDRLMTKFFGTDADRNLSETATLALVGSEDGNTPCQYGYEAIGDKQFRVLIAPVVIILDTHAV